jgi:hypothetical protein
MTPEQLAAIKARTDAATPGPWWYDPRSGEVLGFEGAPVCDLLPMSEDIAFICSAREDVPALLAEVERLNSWGDMMIGQFDAALVERDEARYDLANAREAGAAYKRQRDEARAENARLRAQVAAVEALCDEREAKVGPLAVVDAAAIRNAIAEAGGAS